MKRITFKNKDGSVGVLIPAVGVLDEYGIDAIAQKDVPAPYLYVIEWSEEGEPLEQKEYNTPYWIVDTESIPEDRTFRDAWEIDEEELGAPHGYGSPSNEFK